MISFNPDWPIIAAALFYLGSYVTLIFGVLPWFPTRKITYGGKKQ